ncbi:hypothetical protein OBBRIDRAFT_720074 [Obba rivulosa]|uniref:RlpA-like protein double-psi beta-barrel domain-containing protein n=1 Tax=Obba rivulosa TaxID=1052685 RepID=A0A8E2DTY2_9APHY|nr:hypothetical protein OBBRIDRAFT_720074 [Obba rivulosa]
MSPPLPPRRLRSPSLPPNQSQALLLRRRPLKLHLRRLLRPRLLPRLPPQAATSRASCRIRRRVKVRHLASPIQCGARSCRIGTFYATGLGACGITNTDSDFIIAVSHLLFDAFPGYDGVNPNLNPVCNKKIQAHYQGNSVTVTVTDRCTGCAVSDLDFSPAAFSQLADESIGRIFGMTWDWLD